MADLYHTTTLTLLSLKSQRSGFSKEILHESVLKGAARLDYNDLIFFILESDLVLILFLLSFYYKAPPVSRKK